MRRHASDSLRDIGIVALSVTVAILLARSGIVDELLASVGGFAIIGGFIAGTFFVSVFTVAPAAAVLVELFRGNSLLDVAIAAAAGGLVGDWIMFRFLRDHVAADLAYLASRPPFRRSRAVFRLKSFHWLTPLLGAVIVASPLPDEIGLALMGISGLRTALFLPLSFGLNFSGLLVLGLLTRAAGS